MSPDDHLLRGWRAPLVLLGVVLLFCAPMLAHPDGLVQGDGFRDEDWLHDISFSFFLKEGLLRHGEFPLRSHQVGGGYPILGHPSDGTLSPFSLPFLVLPPGAAVRLNLVLLLWLGTLGVWGLARRELGLTPVGSLLAASAFAVSGWFPSMMLAGFYVQCFYLLVPLALHVLLGPGGNLRRGLLVGLLLLPLLLQSGPALAAVLHFLLVAGVLLADRTQGPADLESPSGSVFSRLGWLLAVLGGVSLLAPGLGLGAVLAALVAAVVWRTRHALAPIVLRLALAVLVLGTVGAAKWVSILDVTTRGTDFFSVGDDEGKHYPWGQTGDAERSFYASLPSFLVHLHRPLARVTDYPEPFSPEAEEYAPLGLTAPVALAFLAAALAVWRRLLPWALLFALYLLVCSGPYLLVDPYRLLVWGLPGYEVISDPYKYFNFFLLIPVALGFGMAAELCAARIGRAGLGACAALLLWPVALNAPLFATLFSEPAPPPEPIEGFHQRALVPPPGAATFFEHPEMYREFYRPSAAQEFVALPSGFGVVNWYADIYLPERAVPRVLVTSGGLRSDGPGWRGEAFCLRDCVVRSAAFSPNTVTVVVENDRPARVVINQNHDPAWVASAGTIVNQDGLLAVDVPPGVGTVTVRYRPRAVLAALAVSALSLAVVLALLRASWRRSRRSADDPRVPDLAGGGRGRGVPPDGQLGADRRDP